MKTFRHFLDEQDGLAHLGQQDLADDHERPEDEQQPQTPPAPDNSFPSTEDELSVVRKAMRIVLKAGDKYRHRVHEFLRRMARDIPELQNIVGHFKDEDDTKMDEPESSKNGNSKMVSTPSADIPSDDSGSLN
jgi:hypothetical protein